MHCAKRPRRVTLSSQERRPRRLFQSKMCLAFYLYKIKKYEDENLDENGHVQAYSNHSASVNSVDTEACPDCSCGKIQGKIFSVILGIMIRMSKDGGLSLTANDRILFLSKTSSIQMFFLVQN